MNTQYQSSPDDLSEKKGDLGETIVQHILEQRCACVYKHLGKYYHWDFIICNNSFHPNARFKIAAYADVKTKPRRQKSPDTGLDTSNYKYYKEISDKSKTDFHLYFVDTIDLVVYLAIVGKTPCHIDGKQTYFYTSDLTKYQIPKKFLDELKQLERESNARRPYDYSMEMESW